MALKLQQFLSRNTQPYILHAWHIAVCIYIYIYGLYIDYKGLLASSYYKQSNLKGLEGIPR